MRGRGISKIFRRNFFSQCREISYGKPSALCFKKIAVAKNFMDKRGGGYQDFLSKIFCLTVPKNFVMVPFCAVF